MSSAVNLIVAVLLFFTSSSLSAKDVNILILREHVTADCQRKLSGALGGIYQIDMQADALAVGSPDSWDTCANGLIFHTLSQAMIQSGMADHVTLTPVGIPTGSLNEWFVSGRAHEKMKSVAEKANAKNITFDYVLWDGGLIDGEFSASTYQIDVQKILKEVKLGTKVEKFIISKSVSCTAGIESHGRAYRWDPLFRRFSGPDIGKISREYYADKCNFTEAGQKKIAQLWLEAIKKADIEDKKYQKESLLHYFK